MLRGSADHRALGASAIGWQSSRAGDGQEDTSPAPSRESAEGRLLRSAFMPSRRGELAATHLRLRVRHLDGSSRSSRAPRFRSRRQRRALRGTGVTRRLLMEETRVLSRPDCRRSVTSASRDMPPLRARRLNLEGRSKGAWCGSLRKEGRSPRGGSGTRSNRIGPRITETIFERGSARTSCPSCTWSKRRSQP